MHIPWNTLEAETLERLLSEIVTRDGTDYGRVERSTESKIQSAIKSLQSGKAQLHWDEETESASLVTIDQLREDAAQLDKLSQASGIGARTKD